MRTESEPQPMAMTPRLRRWLGMMAYLLVFSYPLIHADRLYRDDIWRSFHGEMGWVANGRPLASLVMLILNGGPRLADLFPLPLWLGLAAVAAALLLWQRRLQEFDNGHAWVAMLILVAQPFFLQNLSYRFDALPMCLALASAVLGISLALDPREDRRWQARFRWLAGGASLLASLLFYQPAANVFFVLLAFHVALTTAQQGRPHWSLQFQALVIGVVALLASKLISHWLIGGGYSRDHSVLAPTLALPGHMIEQTLRFWHYALANLGVTNARSFLLLAAIVAIGLIVETVRHRRSSGLIALLLVLLCLPLGGLGFLAALADPIWRPRVMIGFGALQAGILFCVLRWIGRTRHRWLGRALLIVALGMPLTLAYSYGNAQRHQALFADDVAMQLIDDLATQPEAAPLVIDGVLPYSRPTRNAIAVHPMIGELIFRYLDGYYWWGYQDLYRRGLSEAFVFHGDIDWRWRFEGECHTLTPLVKRAWYTLYRFESHYVVALSGRCHSSYTASELPIDD